MCVESMTFRFIHIHKAIDRLDEAMELLGTYRHSLS